MTREQRIEDSQPLCPENGKKTPRKHPRKHPGGGYPGLTRVSTMVTIHPLTTDYLEGYGCDVQKYVYVFTVLFMFCVSVFCRQSTLLYSNLILLIIAK